MNNENYEQSKQNHNSVRSSTDFLTKGVRRGDDGSMRSKRNSEKNKEDTQKRDVVG